MIRPNAAAFDKKKSHLDASEKKIYNLSEDMRQCVDRNR